MSKIAIIEDAPDNAEFIVVVLEEALGKGSTTTFETGEDFLARFRRSSFALIILDIALPGMDGFKIMGRLRSIDPDVPVIAVTAHVFAADRNKAFQKGMSAYVAKPILNIGDFCSLVASYLKAPWRGYA